MDATHIAGIVAAFTIAGLLKGVTGVGFSTLCLPLLAVVVDHKVAIPLVLIPSLASNVLVMRDAGGFWTALRRFWPLYLALPVGLALGVWALSAVDSADARRVLGAVLIGYALWALVHGEQRLSQHLAHWLAVPVGVVNGAINALTGSQVLPLLPYLSAQGLDRQLFIQALNIGFTWSSLLLLPALGTVGLVQGWMIAVALGGLLPVAGAVWLGGSIRRQLKPVVFERAVLALVLGSGLALIA